MDLFIAIQLAFTGLNLIITIGLTVLGVYSKFSKKRIYSQDEIDEIEKQHFI